MKKLLLFALIVFFSCANESKGIIEIRVDNSVEKTEIKENVDMNKFTDKDYVELKRIIDEKRKH